MSFRFIDHPADIAVEVEAETLEGLFEEAAFALKEASCETQNVNSSKSLSTNLPSKIVTNEIALAKVVKIIKCSEENLELLLAEFLNELNFYIQSGKWIFHSINKINVTQSGNKFNLTCQLTGNEMNRNNFMIKEEIKAVTFHQMKIEKKNNKFFTRVIFDI